MATALGIDVGVRKGLDLVLLDDSLRPALPPFRVPGPDEVEAWLRDHRPDVVAIDSPPGFGRSGRSRAAEAELRSLGIQSYGTPSNPEDGARPFHDWMRRGFEVHAAAARGGYERYARGRKPEDVSGHALEVFPHASAVFLASALPPAGTARSARAKRVWRLRVLGEQGVETAALRTLDQVDAALAALTGLMALHGAFLPLGDPEEGVIVVPGRVMPEPFRREIPQRKRPPRGQPSLPGMRPCACGDPSCRSFTSGEFAPGHDAKRKSLLWRRVREGQEAESELSRRGWRPPPRAK